MTLFPSGDIRSLHREEVNFLWVKDRVYSETGGCDHARGRFIDHSPDREHTILGFSTCTDTIATNYLIELRQPGPGTVCHPNAQPFPFLADTGAGRDRS